MEFQPWKYTFLIFIQNGLLISLLLFLVIKMQLGIPGYIAGTALVYLVLIPFCVWMVRHHLHRCFSSSIAKKNAAFWLPVYFCEFWLLDVWLHGSVDADGCTRIQYMFSKCVKCQKPRLKPDELAYFKAFGKKFTNFSLNKNDLNTYFCEACVKIVEAYLRTYQTRFATEDNLKFTIMWNDAL